MATATLTKQAAKGGSFLLESAQPGDVFTPADLTDDQKLIGQTAEEFVLKEVLPVAKELENKKPGLMVELVKKGGEVGLMGGGVPEEYGGAGLDKISTTTKEKISAQARNRRVDRRVLSLRATSWVRRAKFPDARRTEQRRYALHPQRAEDVDHQWRFRGRLHCIRED